MGAELKPSQKYPKGVPVVVAVADGFGDGEYTDEYNAIHVANTPTFDKLRAARDQGKYMTVQAHGTAVGLPSDKDMGNSEVGHNALGAGRVVDQGASLVDKAIASGSIFRDKGWEHVKESFNGENTLHLVGLLSDGGVHSRIDQLQALLRGAKNDGCKKIRLHILTDGRDVGDGTSVGFVQTIEGDLKSLREEGIDAQIASGGGRMNVTMDRYEADWEIVQRGWQAHILGKARREFESAEEAVKTMRKEGMNDQNMDPFVVVNGARQAVGPVDDGDGLILFNFRGDRMLEMAQSIEYSEGAFKAYERERVPKNLRFVSMMQYDGELKLPERFLVSPPAISGTAGEVLAENRVKQFACAETHKFGHVTYFWNGNRGAKFDSTVETYTEVHSGDPDFTREPQMKAQEVTDAAVEALESKEYDFLRINYANTDMVGHTGDLKATILAAESVDKALGDLIGAVNKHNGIFIFTGDHGNAENMASRDSKGNPKLDQEGNVIPLTSHTLAPVPLAIGGSGLKQNAVVRDDVEKPGLANVTATYIDLLGFEPPENYEPSLVKLT